MKSNEQMNSIRGRGSLSNPQNRFEEMSCQDLPDRNFNDDPKLQTKIFIDHSKSILSRNDSPDVGFSTGINPYRGCEHGCVYCFARPSHEYLGFSSGLDFESKIMAKPDAPYLLRKELSSKKYKPEVIALSGNTDCYQPIEKKLGITRQCLEVLRDFRNPVGLITKNKLITRDIDLLSELASFNACSAFISVTSLNKNLASKMEPRASAPQDRLIAASQLASAGIPVGILIAPVIPGLNDHEIPAILRAAKKAGASNASYIMLRLPYAIKDLFSEWLTQHFPDRKIKVLNHIRAVRGGQLYDSTPFNRMKGTGLVAEHIKKLFYVSRRKVGLDNPWAQLTTEHFRKITQGQMELFN